MDSLSSISNVELRQRLSSAVSTERAASAAVIAHLAELDRRRLYLEDACSSLYAYCIERLGYSEDAAMKRVRVARLVHRLPQVLDELASGSIHLTGLYLLSQHLTNDNADALLCEARGKSRRQIEEALARWAPRPDVPPTVKPVPTGPAQGTLVTLPGQGGAELAPARPRLEPLSVTRWRVEFMADVALHDKLELAVSLASHSVPSGDLAAVIERALDHYIEVETRRRSGAGQPRKRRPLKLGSRHVPVDVERLVRERDGQQCAFVDVVGRRCSEKRFLTLEHIQPFALGGPPTLDNLQVLCTGHNARTARQVFGEEHIQKKVTEAREKRAARTRAADVEPAPECYENVLSALVRMGFSAPTARRALAEARQSGVEAAAEPLLRAALARLTPEGRRRARGQRPRADTNRSGPYALGQSRAAGETGAGRVSQRVGRFSYGEEGTSPDLAALLARGDEG